MPHVTHLPSTGDCVLSSGHILMTDGSGDLSWRSYGNSDNEVYNRFINELLSNTPLNQTLQYVFVRQFEDISFVEKVLDISKFLVHKNVSRYNELNKK